VASLPLTKTKKPAKKPLQLKSKITFPLGCDETGSCGAPFFLRRPLRLPLCPFQLCPFPLRLFQRGVFRLRFFQQLGVLSPSQRPDAKHPSKVKQAINPQKLSKKRDKL
jgi:hypothetical protein